MIHRGLCGLVAALAVALAGCAAAPVAPAGPAFGEALARVDGPFAGYVAFVDTAAVAAGTGPWTALAGGDLAAHAAPLAEVLRVDLAAAGSTLTAGLPPRAVTLVSGGQDADAIRSAATGAGWSGDDVLRRDLDLTEPLTLQAGTVRPLDDDVVLGAPTAPVDLVDGPGAGLDADPGLAAVVACLGDAAVVTVENVSRTGLRAVGLRRTADPAAVESVLCVQEADPAAVTAAVTTGRTLDGRPWAQYLAQPVVERLAGPVPLVRLTARNGPDAPAGLLLAALARRDLPGVPA